MPGGIEATVVWQVQVAAWLQGAAQDSELSSSEQVAGGPKLSLGETVAMVAAATGFKLLQQGAQVCRRPIELSQSL